MNGFLNLLKPPGMSSGACAAVVKRLTGERVGHAGTLDPEAAGVLPIMVGRATRLLDYFPDHSKSYVAEMGYADPLYVFSHLIMVLTGSCHS